MTDTRFPIALINSDQYGVVAHKQGCKDIAKDEKKHGGDTAWNIEVLSQREAFLEYNSDLIEDGDESNTWPIHFHNCASDVPAEVAVENLVGLTPEAAEVLEDVEKVVKPMTKTKAYARTSEIRKELAAIDRALEGSDLAAVILAAENAMCLASALYHQANDEGVNRCK